MDKQFSKEEVADKVLEQYDEEITRVFYQCVMGGGGHDIHFGIYKNPEDGVKVLRVHHRVDDDPDGLGEDHHARHARA